MALCIRRSAISTAILKSWIISTSSLRIAATSQFLRAGKMVRQNPRVRRTRSSKSPMMCGAALSAASRSAAPASLRSQTRRMAVRWRREPIPSRTPTTEWNWRSTNISCAPILCGRATATQRTQRKRLRSCKRFYGSSRRRRSARRKWRDFSSFPRRRISPTLPRGRQMWAQRTSCLSRARASAVLPSGRKRGARPCTATSFRRAVSHS